MKVVTLDNKAFYTECRRLEDEAASFCPDVIVGIATGGVEVARLIFTDVPHLSVDAHRPSTKTKKRNGAVMGFVRCLPRPVKDLLRIAESKILSLRRPGSRKVALDATSIVPFRRVLVVDDAVDSGATARAVIDALNTIPGNRTIALAVLTVTTRHPAVNADFALYRNRTLLRFPWSMDK